MQVRRALAPLNWVVKLARAVIVASVARRPEPVQRYPLIALTVLATPKIVQGSRPTPLRRPQAHLRPLPPVPPGIGALSPEAQRVLSEGARRAHLHLVHGASTQPSDRGGGEVQSYLRQQQMERDQVVAEIRRRNKTEQEVLEQRLREEQEEQRVRSRQLDQPIPTDFVDPDCWWLRPQS